MYKKPIIKPKLSEHQQSMLNLIRLIKGENLPLRQAAKEFYELRYPTGIQNHVCTQMRKKASHHKSVQNEGGNLKQEYFLHCIGSTDYIVEEWSCKKVRKQITKWNGTNTFIPTGEYEEYYNLYLKGYWLNEIPKKQYPLADLIPKHIRHIPGSEVSHPGLHPKFRNEDGSQMTVEERKAKYVNWMTSDDWPNPIMNPKLSIIELICKKYEDLKPSFLDKDNILWKISDGKFIGKPSIQKNDFGVCWLDETNPKDIKKYLCEDTDYTKIYKK